MHRCGIASRRLRAACQPATRCSRRARAITRFAMATSRVAAEMIGSDCTCCGRGCVASPRQSNRVPETTAADSLTDKGARTSADAPPAKRIEIRWLVLTSRSDHSSAHAIECLMGKITGFLEYERNDRDYEPVEERIKHWREFVLPLPEEENKKQAARCMDCGIPYCHGTNVVTGAPTGCPVNNQIPDWNDLVYRGDWQEAARNLHSTNNFPEVTGRVCPAPCEASCTLNIDDNPVTIKTIECAIADRAIAAGLDQAGAAVGQDRQESRDRRLGSRRHGLRAAARARRPRRARVREIRQGRRPDALRHPRLQDGEASRRPARRADGSRRRDLPLRRPCRREPAGGEAARRLRRGRARGRRREGRATCRSPAASSTASISRWISCRSRTGA